MTMQIPDYLFQQVKDGKVVLFLGAGASIGAMSTKGLKIPDAQGLVNLLSDKFLGGQDKNRPLSVVADYAIDASDLITMQGYIKEIFSEFTPALFHMKIPTFKWAAIVTTNYDQILESSYSSSKDAKQRLKPIFKSTDRIEDVVRDENSVLYLKLHGCISKWDDSSIPLILTIDQYASHKKNRQRLFERFESYASDLIVIFVGYRLEDPDLRQLLIEIADQGISRPRYYVVTPNPNPRDIRIWEQKRIQALNGTFEEFLDSLEESIPNALRSINTQDKIHPVESKFVFHQHLSPSTLSFLNKEVTYIVSNLSTEQPDARAFYKGASYGWAAIEAKFDAPRSLVNQLLTDIVITDEADRTSPTEFYLVKGYAGSGKTVLLKRLAWDAAIDFNCISLFLNGDGHIRIEPLQELCDLTNERIFIFIDRPSTRHGEIEKVISSSASRKLKVTFVCAERTNEWNIECQNLAKLVDESYELRGLSLKEINELIDKLDAHSCLGALSGQSREEQVKTFLDYANRQLLVALYESTSGKPFEEIIFNEYKNIVPEQARQIYLIICSLNRLQVPVRAGIVKRLTGISFSDFKENFFGPLESIVFAEEYKPALDMAYRTRHPWIAETIFERALPEASERFDLYIRLLGAMGTGYQPDRIAYRELVRAKDLMADFSDYQHIIAIYKTAQDRFIDDPYLLQQQGIFEMKRANGNLDRAYSLFSEARRIAPYDSSILHSLSELEFHRAHRTSGGLERDRHLQASKEIAQSLIGKNGDTAHAYVTIVKINTEKLIEMIEKGVIEEGVFTSLVKEIEKTIQDGLQYFPDDEFLRSAEARFLQLIAQEQKATQALEKAFNSNSSSPYISRSLSKLYESQGKIELARSVLSKCLDILPAEKSVNSAMAKIFNKHFPSENLKAEIHWRRSFTDGDSNFTNQFWYARQLFINKKADDAKRVFIKLKKARVDPEVKLEVRGIIKGDSGNQRVYSGEVVVIGVRQRFLHFRAIRSQ